MIIVMLQTLEACPVEDEAIIRNIVANSKQVVMNNEKVYFIINEDYEK